MFCNIGRNDVIVESELSLMKPVDVDAVDPLAPCRSFCVVCGLFVVVVLDDLC